MLAIRQEIWGFERRRVLEWFCFRRRRDSGKRSLTRRARVASFGEEGLKKVITVFLGEFFQKSKQNNHIMGSFFGG